MMKQKNWIWSCKNPRQARAILLHLATLKQILLITLIASNTDNNIYTAALGIPFMQQAQYGAMRTQRGFVRCRNIIDNSVALDSWLSDRFCSLFNLNAVLFFSRFTANKRSFGSFR